MRNRRKAGKKAFSSVVGAVFMVVIMWVLASSYFVFTLSANTTYNNSVAQNNRLNFDRLSESPQVGNTTYTPYDNGVVNVYAPIQNIGSSSIQFVTVWLYVHNASWNNYNWYKLTNASVQGGNFFTLDANVTVPGLNSSYTYSFASWIVTARGNVVALPTTTVYGNNIIVSQVTQGIGALMMDFHNFTYYNVTGNKLGLFPNGASGYVVSSNGGNLAFKVVLTNLDLDQRLITLSSNSVFFSIFPTTPQQVRGSYWYIVNVDGTGTISSTFSTIVLPFNVPVTVYFASDHAIVSGKPFVGAPAVFLGTSPVNLALIGTLGGQPFGQNIPFVSILILS